MARSRQIEERVPGMGLYGLYHSNRDFELPSCWKKNIFNNAFPVGLAAWMHDRNMPAVYLTLGADRGVVHGWIDFPATFGLEPQDAGLYHKFESDYPPYAAIAAKRLPSIDLVTFDRGGTRRRTSTQLRDKAHCIAGPQHSLA